MKIQFLLLAAIIGAVFCDTCLQSVNPVSKGSPCSSTTDCKYGSFCNIKGVCQENLEEGESCEKRGVCKEFLTCKGPENQKVCVKIANLGESCTTDSTNTIPLCPRSCQNNVCVFGQIGDTCKSSSECSPLLVCAQNDDIKKQVCTPVTLNTPCNFTTVYTCPPGSYCDSKTCIEKKKSGPCNVNEECAYGFLCSRNSERDDRQCVAAESKLGGQYCDSPYVCESLRCQRNRCAEKGRADLCSSSEDCGVSATCRCQGFLKETGYGKCVTNPCFSLSEKLQECMYTHCPTSSSSDNFPESCVENFCKKYKDSLNKCNSVSRVLISSTTFLLAALAVFLAIF